MLHRLAGAFAREFRLLQPHEREEVARQMLGFLGAYVASEDSDWRRLVMVDGDATLGPSSVTTLIELLNESCTDDGRRRRGS